MSLLVSSEPRPLLTDYVLTKYGARVTSALSQLYWKRKDERKSFLYACESYEKPSRKIKLLEEPELGSFKERFEGMRSNFMVFHVLFKDKDACIPRLANNVNQKKNSPRHGVMLLYNKTTHTLYNYDIFRYHYRGFKSHLFGKRLKSAFIPWLREFDPDVKLADNKMAGSKRVITFVSNKLQDPNPSIKVWYPLYVLYELDTMMANPSLTTSELKELFVDMDEDKFAKKLDELYFSFYRFLSEFYDTYNTCTKKSRIVDPAKQVCVSATGKRGLELKGVSNICPQGKVLSLYKRCVKSKFFEHFDVKASKHIDTPKREEFIKLGSLMGNTIALMYLTTKFKNTTVYLPPRARWESLRKEDLRFVWRYDTTAGWVLDVPDGFDAFWSKFMKDKKVQYLLIPVSLVSKPKENFSTGHHANVMIYNKETNELEHFEPHGLELSKESYNPDELYASVREVFRGKVKKYYSPIQLCPKNMQFFQTMETDEAGFLEDHGHCAVWCIWYADVRLSNPKMSRAEVIKTAMQKLLDMGSLRMFIWNYEKHFEQIIHQLSGHALAELKKKKVIQQYM